MLPPRKSCHAQMLQTQWAGIASGISGLHGVHAHAAVMVVKKPVIDQSKSLHVVVASRASQMPRQKLLHATLIHARSMHVWMEHGQHGVHGTCALPIAMVGCNGVTELWHIQPTHADRLRLAKSLRSNHATKVAAEQPLTAHLRPGGHGLLVHAPVMALSIDLG